MAQQLDHSQQIQQLQMENKKLQAENKRLSEQNTNQRELLAEATSELYWLQCLIANPEVQGNQARVLYAIHQLSSLGKRREDGMIRMYRGAIVQRAGLAPNTVSRIIRKLVDTGNLHRDLTTTGGGADDVEKELYLSIPDTVLKNPGGIIAHADDSNWGGDSRVRTCRTCGSPDLLEIHHFVCRHCGTDHQPDETIDVLESTLQAQAIMEAEMILALEYPQGRAEAMASYDVLSPQRACLRCGEQLWLPAYQDDKWIYLCGGQACHPHLMESKGRDLTTGSAYQEEGS